jgi:hypothetical protein
LGVTVGDVEPHNVAIDIRDEPVDPRVQHHFIAHSQRRSERTSFFQASVSWTKEDEVHTAKKKGVHNNGNDWRATAGGGFVSE